MKNKKRSDTEEQVRRIVKPIFDKVLQETDSNSMTTPKKPVSIIWRPNNYRRQIEVKLKDNSTIKKIKSAIPQANINDHTRLISIKNYTPNITIQYGKNTLTAIYSQNVINGTKETFLIEAYSIDDIEKRLNQKKEEIKGKIDDTLNIFSKQFGIKLPLRKPVWSRYEDFVKGEDYIDKIPKDVIIHDTYFKKVYGKGIEFIKKGDEEPITHLKNYIKTRAVEDITPHIAESINALGTRFDMFFEKVLPPIQEYAVHMRSHAKFMQQNAGMMVEVKGILRKLNNKLSQTRLTGWI